MERRDRDLSENLILHFHEFGVKMTFLLKNIFIYSRLFSKLLFNITILSHIGERLKFFNFFNLS